MLITPYCDPYTKATHVDSSLKLSKFWALVIRFGLGHTYDERFEIDKNQFEIIFQLPTRPSNGAHNNSEYAHMV